MKTKRTGPRYRARASEIHGRGVFAETDFAKGERIGEYRGKLIRRSTMDRLAQRADRRAEYRAGVTYFFIVDDEWAIDGRTGGGWTRLINHSCQPNCIAESEGRGIFIRALKRIKAGDELTYDYLLDPGDPGETFTTLACACGTRTCRGTMVDPTALTPAMLRTAVSRARGR